MDRAAVILVVCTVLIVARFTGKQSTQMFLWHGALHAHKARVCFLHSAIIFSALPVIILCFGKSPE